MSEPHDVVKLLAARMESHPEEFAPDGEGRWAQWLDELIPFVTEAERVLLRGPMMQTFHEQVLDELMNGPERRRKEAEERESIMQSALAKQQQTQRNLQQFYDADLDRYQNAGVTHIAGEGPYLKAGITTQPTLSSSAINQIKQALGIKK